MKGNGLLGVQLEGNNTIAKCTDVSYRSGLTLNEGFVLARFIDFGTIYPVSPILAVCTSKTCCKG